jgi:membrane associated rhomboid family serine protease
MFIPISDDNSSRRTVPVLNLVLIAINVFVFFGLQQGQDASNAFTQSYSLVPAEILTGKDEISPAHTMVVHQGGREVTVTVPGLGPTRPSVYVTLLTSIFMHGSIMHLVGNMIFLWIFGDNLEDALGRVRYLMFYLACGVGAGLVHVATTRVLGGNPLIPCLGASGAISGVLAGYLMLFPKNTVHVLFLRSIIGVPAFVVVGGWFLFQLGSAWFSLSSREGGGVAYGAHIGGFLIGMPLVFLLGGLPQRAAKVGPWGDRFS